MISVARDSTWPALSSQATLLLLTGIALGPQGVALLTPEALEILRPTVPVALAVLGVTAVLGPSTRLSSALILAAGIAMALHLREAVDAAATVAQAASIATLLAGAGWILSRGASDEERRVFSLAIFLLLGGVADYLSVSGLLLGWVAATASRLVRTTGLADAGLDAAYVQHPITALLLITAGARAKLSWPLTLFALAAVCVVMALVLLLRRQRPGSAAALGAGPLTPVFAVALAMDAARLDPRLTAMLSVVVLAAATLDVLSGHATDDAA